MRFNTFLLASALTISALGLPLASSAWAQQPVQADQAKTIRIEHPWARATAPGAKAAGGFLGLINAGTATDKLTGGTVDFADKVEVHEMAVVDNVMTMKRLDTGLEIAPGATAELKPGGYHIMFVGLKRQLADGETVKVVLNFEKAGAVSVDFAVKSVPNKNGHAAH